MWINEEAVTGVQVQRMKAYTGVVSVCGKEECERCDC